MRLLEEVLALWDGIGIWDTPAMIDDGNGERIRNEAAIYKMALLLITVQVLDSFRDFHQVEQRIWDNQDPATGGIRTGIKPDGSMAGGCNTETAALVLLIYDAERIEMLKEQYGPE